MTEELKSKIREIPDFPKPGILFYDITTLLEDGPTLRKAVDAIADQWSDKPFDVIVGVEARGFIFASALAYKLGIGMAIVRKPGKLPSKSWSISYDLEYGTDSLEVHQDAIKPGQKVLILDDLLATGGTVAGVVDLITKFDAEIVGVGFLIELTGLKGRAKLDGQEVRSLISYAE